MSSKDERQEKGVYPKLRAYLRDGFLADTSAREAFTRGFLNVLAYARIVQPSVSRSVGRSVSISAIAMALRRMNNRHTHYVQPTPTIRDVSVRNGLTHCRYGNPDVAREAKAWFEKRGGIVPLIVETEQGSDCFFPMDHLVAFSEESALHDSLKLGEVELAAVSFRLENPEALPVVLQTIFSLPLAFRYTFFTHNQTTLVLFDEQVPLVLEKL